MVFGNDYTDERPRMRSALYRRTAAHFISIIRTNDIKNAHSYSKLCSVGHNACRDFLTRCSDALADLFDQLVLLSTQGILLFAGI